MDYELLVEHIFESFEAGNASIFHGRNDLPQVRSQIFLGLPALNDALVAHFMFLLREEQIGFLVGDQFFAFGAFKESVLGVIILIICIFDHHVFQTDPFVEFFLVVKTSAGIDHGV